MEFSNSFAVDAPIDRVWRVLTDPREVTPCVPGAQITEMIDETHFQGSVKVKLGAVQMSYRGTMEMQPDEASRTIVLQGKGTATGGGGGASGRVTISLNDADGKTAVDIHSQVDVTGRVAQFGRGIMQDVSNRLIKELAACLQQKLSSAGEEAPAAEEAAPAPGHAPPEPPEVVPGGPLNPGAVSSGAATTPQSAPAPPSTAPARTIATSNELKLSTLVLDITRSKIAEGLRALAKRIEPE